MRTIRIVLLATLLLPSAAIGRVSAQTGPATDDAVPTAPIEIDGAVLFDVRGSSSFPAATRAAAIRQRIISAASDPAVTLVSITSVDREGVSRIASGERLLMTVVDADGAVEGLTRADIAAAHLMRIRQAVSDYRAARSAAALSRATMRTAVASALFVLAIVVLVWFWRWFSNLLRRRVQERIRTVGIQSFELVRAENIRTVLQNAVFALKTIGYVVLTLVFAGFVLRQWPATRGMAHGIGGFITDPLKTMWSGFAANIPSLAFLLVLFLVVRVLLRIIRMFFESVERGTVTLSGFDADWSQPTYKIVRVFVIAFAIVVAYPYIPGSQTEAFKGVSLFIGIVFSLGSSTAIANIMAGYMMTYRRAFKVGDRVKIGDAVGDVIQMRLQVTHLRSLKNEEIVIPNSQILGGEVLNYSSLARERGLLLHTEVGIGYETPWRQVEAMLLSAAARTPGLGTQLAPFVRVKRLGDFAVVYELNAPCGDVPTMNATYTALHHQILDVFNEHGVQIMTPAYEGDPPEPKVVPPAQWYTAPASPAAAAAARETSTIG